MEKTWTAADLAPVPRVMVEPGRSIVAPCAITLYRIGTVKQIPGIGTYLAVDGGMSDNPRPVLYGAGYEAYLPERLDDARPLHCAVVGKHCEQGDVLVADACLPAGCRVGDLLATPTTGAYGYSMASNYNKVTRPAVVFVREGAARLVVRRETLRGPHPPRRRLTPTERRFERASHPGRVGDWTRWLIEYASGSSGAATSALPWCASSTSTPT